MIDCGDPVRRLSSGQERERIYAAEDIGFANNGAGVPPLLSRLAEEPSRAVREAIFSALVRIDDGAVIAGAIGLLDSEDAFLRNEAVELLRVRGSQSLALLAAAFEAGEADRRKLIVDVLSRLPGVDSGSLYRMALADPDLNVVIATIESLAELGNRAFRLEVERLVAAKAHPMLLAACLEALTAIGTPESVAWVRTRLSYREWPGYLLPPWLKLLGTHGGEADAAEIAATLYRPGLVDAALAALTTLRTRFPQLTLPGELAAPLMAVVSHQPAPVRGYQAVRLLGRVKESAEVTEFVASCLLHKEGAIRLAAIQAIREAGGERAQALVARILAKEADPELLLALESEGEP